jgi:hypothetical protein
VLRWEQAPALGITGDDLQQARAKWAFVASERASPNGRSMSAEASMVTGEAAIFHGDTWLMMLRSDDEAHAAGTLSFVGGKGGRRGGCQHP